MDQPASYEKTVQLTRKGVSISNPATVDIGDEVDINQISGNGTKIYPGCRIYGSATIISSGCKLGYEAPVTLDDCQLGPKVELKGGYFNKSTFLEKANMGSGAQVREGCILEEEANGAHCVGLKQTILFPFVTLGSLINFCDCFMAGGTSRKTHSEVGSSYIHFNYTPDGDKTTASLIGDVPRGVMLNQPAIFLGGQGGMVGPCRIGYGNVIAANSILRSDYIEDNKLVVGKNAPGKVMDFEPRAYPNLRRIVENNIIYLANLLALEEWYKLVRKSFFEPQEFGPLIFAGLIDKLSLGKKERLKRLRVLSEKVAAGSTGEAETRIEIEGRRQLKERFSELEHLFNSAGVQNVSERHRDDFLGAFAKAGETSKSSYVDVIQTLSDEISKTGTLWLQSIVDGYVVKAESLLPSLVFCK